MRIQQTKAPLLIALICVLAVVSAGCNSDTDDPGISVNNVTVASISPTDACVDIDGEPTDTDGDGTVDSNVFTSVLQQIAFDSRTRNNFSVHNDVIFSAVDIDYIMTAGPAPPNRTDAVTITVPAGGTASTGLNTVQARDVPSFDSTSRGAIRLTFRGEDVTGEPATATGQTELHIATICGGN